MLKGLCVKNISSIFFLVIVILLTACNENKERIKEVSLVEKKEKELAQKHKNESLTVDEIIKEKRVDRFVISDLSENNLTFTLSQAETLSSNIKQPIILINFFSTWSPPCRSELSELSKLQKKYNKELFVVGILVNDQLSSVKLKYFTKKYHANYFISASKESSKFSRKITQYLNLSTNYPLPLSVLYKNGKYYRFYEGAMPIEMMDYELKQAIKQL